MHWLQLTQNENKIKYNALKKNLAKVNLRKNIATPTFKSDCTSLIQ